MSLHHLRTFGLAVVVGAVALAAGPAAVAAPTTQPHRSPRCTSGVTYRILLPVVARLRIVNVRSANIRRGPGTDCSLITSVRRGTRLNGTGRTARVGNSRWLEVRGVRDGMGRELLGPLTTRSGPLVIMRTTRFGRRVARHSSVVTEASEDTSSHAMESRTV
mgnify:CR=1 FL=1